MRSEDWGFPEDIRFWLTKIRAKSVIVEPIRQKVKHPVTAIIHVSEMSNSKAGNLLYD